MKLWRVGSFELRVFISKHCVSIETCVTRTVMETQ